VISRIVRHITTAPLFTGKSERGALSLGETNRNSKENKMLRAVLVASAILAFGAVQASAEDYYDRDNQFRVTIPDGWIKNKTENIDLLIQSPRFETTRGACAMFADPFPATRGMTQDKINEELEGAINETFWRSALSRVGAIDVVIDETGSELRKGKRVFLASVRLTGKKDDGTTSTARMKATFEVAPDQIAMSTCVAAIEHEATETADIKTVMSSFEGLGGQIVAGVRQPKGATLMLYAGPNFNGDRREVGQDIPNLFQSGWSIPTASLGLGGFGLWQVCDGMNYTGNCRTLSGAMSVAGGDRPLRIGSARRFVAQGTVRNVLGLVADGIATQGAEGFAKVMTRGRRR
jgi:hypothetical protein